MAIDWCGKVEGEARGVGTFQSHWGPCTVVTCPEGILSVDWGGALGQPMEQALAKRDRHTERKTEAADGENESSTDSRIESDEVRISQAALFAETAIEQLEQYFAGSRHSFTLPLVLRGTEFQKSVWKYLTEIPYGETRSYGDVARAIGRDKAVRAVGQANRRNPVPIVVPCHRVIGSHGELTGYAGSQVHLKAALLNLERGIGQD